MRDDFIFKTNFVEGRGYEIHKDFVNGYWIGKYRFQKGEWKKGNKKFINQMECQKAVAEALYEKLKDK